MEKKLSTAVMWAFEYGIAGWIIGLIGGIITKSGSWATQRDALKSNANREDRERHDARQQLEAETEKVKQLTL